MPASTSVFRLLRQTLSPSWCDVVKTYWISLKNSPSTWRGCICMHMKWYTRMYICVCIHYRFSYRILQEAIRKLDLHQHSLHLPARVTRTRRTNFVWMCVSAYAKQIYVHMYAATYRLQCSQHIHIYRYIRIYMHSYISMKVHVSVSRYSLVMEPRNDNVNLKSSRHFWYLILEYLS